jgi:hypothetical protein
MCRSESNLSKIQTIRFSSRVGQLAAVGWTDWLCFLARAGIFLSTMKFRPEICVPGVKWLERDADYSPATSAKLKIHAAASLIERDTALEL